LKQHNPQWQVSACDRPAIAAGLGSS
jgi:hypothetical protein